MHPAESGDLMYLNILRLREMTDRLRNDCQTLSLSKDRLERQIARLARNTQTETAVAKLKVASVKLEEEIRTLKEMIAALERIAELYSSSEESVINQIENGEGVSKKGVVPYRKNSFAFSVGGSIFTLGST